METTQNLHQIVYTSISTGDIEEDISEIERLLTQCRTNNFRNDITGILLLRNNCFIQVLEGPVANVKKLLHRIKDDPRHREISILLNSPIPNRNFPDWTMGFNGNERDEVRGLSDFLHPVESIDERKIKFSDAKALISNFKKLNLR